MSLLLRPQEIPVASPESNCMFTGNLVATPAAIREFGVITILQSCATLRAAAHRHCGIDYLQVFADLTNDSRRLWFIDDGEHVTALLPEDY